MEWILQSQFCYSPIDIPYYFLIFDFFEVNFQNEKVVSEDGLAQKLACWTLIHLTPVFEYMTFRQKVVQKVHFWVKFGFFGKTVLANESELAKSLDHGI